MSEIVRKRFLRPVVRRIFRTLASLRSQRIISRFNRFNQIAGNRDTVDAAELGGSSAAWNARGNFGHLGTSVALNPVRLSFGAQMDRSTLIRFASFTELVTV